MTHQLNQLNSNSFVAGITLQKKWKNLRTCFAREMRRLKSVKSGAGASRKSEYVYFKQLLFLQNASPNANTEDSIAEKDDCPNDEPQGPYTGYLKATENARKKRKVCNDDTDEVVKLLRKSVDARMERDAVLEGDEDRMFLLSLLSSFKRVPVHKKPMLKITLISDIEAAASPDPLSEPGIFPSTSQTYQERRGYHTQPPLQLQSTHHYNHYNMQYQSQQQQSGVHETSPSTPSSHSESSEDFVHLY